MPCLCSSVVSLVSLSIEGTQTKGADGSAQLDRNIFSKKNGQDENAEPAMRIPHIMSGAYGKHLQVHLPKVILEVWLGQLHVAVTYWLCLSTQR